MNFARKALLILLACFALGSMFMGIRRAVSPGGSQDAQYSGARVLMKGENPYSTWLSGDRHGNYILNQDPNYLPDLFYLISPLTALNWPAARCVWMIINVSL